jgi:hypothetical protein
MLPVTYLERRLKLNQQRNRENLTNLIDSYETK